MNDIDWNFVIASNAMKAAWVAFGCGLFFIALLWHQKAMGLTHKTIFDRMDDDPKALGIYLGLVSLALAFLIGALLK